MTTTTTSISTYNLSRLSYSSCINIKILTFRTLLAPVLFPSPSVVQKGFPGNLQKGVRLTVKPDSFQAKTRESSLRS